MSKLKDIEAIKNIQTFSDFNLLPTLLEGLEEAKLVRPTDIQKRAMPLLLAGDSVVGIAETGSGKTLAYALPILHILKSLEDRGEKILLDSQPRAVVIVPTRELGEQISKVFKIFTHTTRLRVRTVLGGTTLEIAKRNISGPFEVLVATPGRVVKLLERRLLNLSDVRFLVFDEADQMFEQGFIASAIKIVTESSGRPQQAMFSATINKSVQDLLSEIFDGVEVIKSEGSQKLVPTLLTINQKVTDGKRLPILEDLVSKKVVGGTLIFTNTRDQCDVVFEELIKMKAKCAMYRGEMEKVERRSNLRSFRDGKIDFLVSTDLGSRGLDIDHVGRVINYHLPQNIENYIHRVGRTARAGREGTVINLVTERDQPLIDRLEGKHTNKPESLSYNNALPKTKISKKGTSRSSNPQSRRK